MIKSIPHYFDIESKDEVTIELLKEYFDENTYNEELLSILIMDLSFLGPNTETEGNVIIDSIEKDNDKNHYHLNYTIPYFAFNGCKDIDINDDYEVTVNFTFDEYEINFDVIETERVDWNDDI